MSSETGSLLLIIILALCFFSVIAHLFYSSSLLILYTQKERVSFFKFLFLPLMLFTEVGVGAGAGVVAEALSKTSGDNQDLMIEIEVDQLLTLQYAEILLLGDAGEAVSVRFCTKM